MDSQFLALRDRHLQDIRAFTPQAVARLKWSRERILEDQTRRLRGILAHAKEHSPFFAERLKSIDPATFTTADLPEIPPLTKAEVMAHWDDIVTDRRLKLADMNAHLARLQHDPAANPYVLDKYIASATGGSSGKRGLYLWDWETLVVTANIAYRMMAQQDRPHPPAGPKLTAVVCAGSPLHASWWVFPVTLDAERESRVLAADTPIPEMVATLNAWQPDRLVGYGSLIQELVEQAHAGQLTIRPSWVGANSEPLEEGTRALAREAWGVDVHNMWGSVEIGVAAVEGDSFAGLTLAEDFLVFEPVDADGQAAAGDGTADRTLVTKLFGTVMPMIRYEMTDTMVFDSAENPDVPGMRRVLEIKGRADTFFFYGDVKIHPMLFRGLLGQVAAISEYQVQQTPTGAHVLVIAHGPVDTEAAAQQLEAELARAGVTGPTVTLTVVDELPRHAETNKLKRFVPLG